MKKYPVVLALVSIAFAVSGCTAEEVSAPTATVTATVTQTPESESPTPTVVAGNPSTPEEEHFFAAVATSEHSFAESDYEGVLVIGDSICTMYDNDATSADISELLLSGSGFKYTAMELASVHGYAVGALCPEHIEKLK